MVCAPSNLAVDNLFEGLLAAGEKVLRFGHPARVLRDEAKQILADTRRMEAQTVETVLDSANILCATTISLDSKRVGRWVLY